MKVTKSFCKDEKEFISSSSSFIADKINEYIQNKGKCIIGLSGGSTPVHIYKALGENSSIDWNKVKIFLVDDRYINPSEKGSNQKLVRETLLLNASVPDENLIFPNTLLPIDECIKDYENRLKSCIGNDHVDITILGLGEDGHFASIFPHMKNEDMNEIESENRYAYHTTTDVFEVKDRITTTYRVLKNSGVSIFLLNGINKKKVWEEMEASDFNLIRWPAHQILKSSNVHVFFKE